jgi:DNA-binding MarR family transcriptional regulator
MVVYGTVIMETTSHYSKLNSKQLHLLKTIYKFRYVNAKLISEYIGITVSTINQSLGLLVDLGYISRFYDKSYKLNGKGASYYLTLKGINLLKPETGINQHSLKLMYKNKSLSNISIDHHLLILDTYNKFRTKYNQGYRIYGKYELYDDETYPNPPADLYIQKIESTQNARSDYLIDIYEDTPPFVIEKRLKAIMEHLEDEEYQKGTKRAYPSILIICADEKVERKLKKPIEHAHDSILNSEQPILTTTLKRFKNSNSVDDIVWTDALDPEKIIYI